MFRTARAFALIDPGGHVRVETAELHPGGIKICRVTSTGHQVDLEHEESVTLLFPRAGRLRVRMSASEYRINAPSGFVCAPGSRVTRVEAPGNDRLFCAHALVMPAALRGDFAGEGAGRGLRLVRGNGVPVSVRQPEVQQMSALLEYLFGHFDGGNPALTPRFAAGLAVLLDDLMGEILLPAGDLARGDASSPAARRRVGQAEEIMRARSDYPLSLTEIARDLGVGLRCLQVDFLEVRGMAPRDVLARMRMERARDRLLSAQPGDSVTSIALESGFAHLSRFAGAYRRAFGETPAVTLARARQRA